MTERQQTFGKIEVWELNSVISNRPKCTQSKKDGMPCHNNAVIGINNQYESETQYTCETHAKEWMFEELNYFGDKNE